MRGSRGRERWGSLDREGKGIKNGDRRGSNEVGVSRGEGSIGSEGGVGEVTVGEVVEARERELGELM